ncbi:MAG: ABC transporter permease [Gammaproteobacteria bacterium]
MWRRFLFLLALMTFFLLGSAAEKYGIMHYFSSAQHWQYVGLLLIQHLKLVVISMILALTSGLIIGITLSRPLFKRVARIIMYIVGLGQTIPFLALLAFAMLLCGVGEKGAILALYFCSMLPIANNTLVGILGVPHYLIDAAKGIGLSPLQVLYQVELPNAIMIIYAGFRISLVINIGYASLAYLIGAGGLGDLIFTGISVLDTELLLIGVVLAMLLALGADHFCKSIMRFIVPHGLLISAK